MKQTLKFKVELDDNHLPIDIEMCTNNDDNNEESVKALMISAWSAKNKETLRLDLWTKDMLVDDMKKFYHQTLLSMADSFKRSTNEDEISEDIRDFAKYFAEKLKLIG